MKEYEFEVIMLSSESKVKEGEIYHDVDGVLKISKETNRVFTGNHLYFVSYELIKVGDFYIIDDYNLEQSNLLRKVGSFVPSFLLKRKTKKVIATTDKDLTKCSYCNGNHIYDHNMGCERPSGYNRIKLIPDSFKEEYIKSNKIIKTVQLDYEEDCKIHKSFLKITKDFEVIIKTNNSIKKNDEYIEDEIIFLIKEVLNSSKESLEKTKKNHEEMIESYQKNGFGDMHKDNIGEYKTGLNYTLGYTIGHLELLKEINMLFGMSKNEITELIKKNEAISVENEKQMDEILKEIKTKKQQKNKK